MKLADIATYLRIKVDKNNTPISLVIGAEEKVI